MSRKILITGPTSGAGKYLATRLSPGNSLVLVGRNADRLSELKIELSDVTRQLILLECDLSDYTAVLRLCDELESKNIEVDTFISNAGILGNERPVFNSDGYEVTFMTNFLSHYMLQAALLPMLRRNNGIIFNMASQSYLWYDVNFDDIQTGSSYLPMKAYARSKRMLMMLGVWTAGKGITTYNVDPGTFRSGISRSRGMWFQMLYKLGSIGMKPPGKAAADVVNILEDRLTGIPSGSLLKQGKVKEYGFGDEEIGKLIGQIAVLSGIDINERAGQLQ